MLLSLCLLAGIAWPAEVQNPERLEKARAIVNALYAGNGMYDWLGTLIAEHEKYGDEEFAGAWYWSLVYGGANFSLRVGATAPGLCSGPLDVKSTSRSMHNRMRTDTAAHIRHHVDEMWLGYRKGYRGIGLCKYVFLPANPRDWGRGMFRRTDAKHRAVLQEYYRQKEAENARADGADIGTCAGESKG